MYYTGKIAKNVDNLFRLKLIFNPAVEKQIYLHS